MGLINALMYTTGDIFFLLLQDLSFSKIYNNCF